MTKIYDQFDAATRSITAAALLLGGDNVGRIVIKFGAAATAYVQIWGTEMTSGRATGGGYDKASAAVLNAVAKLPIDVGHNDTAAAGLKALRNAFANASSGTGWDRALRDGGFVVAAVI